MVIPSPSDSYGPRPCRPGSDLSGSPVGSLFWVACLSLLLVMGTPLGAVAEGWQDPERLRAVPELSIGELDGAVAFTEVGDLVADGLRVFVSQPQEGLIRVLSAESGSLLEEWGGPGDGPGEFRRMGWMGGSGGTLTVLDRTLHRITVFAEDGSVIESTRFRFPPVERTTPPRVYGGWTRPTADGHLLTVKAPFGPEASQNPPEELPWFLVSLDGAILDRPPPIVVRGRTAVIPREGGTTVLVRPLHQADRFTVAPDGSLLVQAGDPDGSGLRLSIYHTTEQRVDSLHLDVDPVTVDPDEARAELADFVERVEGIRESMGGPLSPLDRRAIEEAIEAPPWIPAVDEMFVTEDGEIWLREPGFGGETRVWRVVGPTGDVEALVEVPAGVVLHARDGSHVWGVRTDPVLGFQVVERLRLERVWPS
jgi:hypothetical protein